MKTLYLIEYYTHDGQGIRFAWVWAKDMANAMRQLDWANVGYSECIQCLAHAHVKPLTCRALVLPWKD